jgi:hypothetical protein
MQGSEIAPQRVQSRQRFAKDIFTTKNAKATKDSEINIYKLRTTVLKSFRSLRKLFTRSIVTNALSNERLSHTKVAKDTKIG